MSDRTRLEKTVITLGLMAVGFGLTWVAAALGIGVFVGKAIAHAEVEEIETPETDAEVVPLLGVVTPRQPVS